MSVGRKIVPCCRKKCILIGRGKKNVLLQRTNLNAYCMPYRVEDSQYFGKTRFQETGKRDAGSWCKRTNNNHSPVFLHTLNKQTYSRGFYGH